MPLTDGREVYRGMAAYRKIGGADPYGNARWASVWTLEVAAWQQTLILQDTVLYQRPRYLSPLPSQSLIPSLLLDMADLGGIVEEL